MRGWATRPAPSCPALPQPDAILEALERLAAGEPREALAAAERALKEAPRDPDASTPGRCGADCPASTPGSYRSRSTHP